MARGSSAQNSGPSKGAGFPPRAGSVTRAAFAVCSSHASGGRTVSPGKSEQPDGNSARRARCGAGIAALARFMRIDEPIVPVSE
jgi:hypothetical protein